jgi:hypothetical protein
VRTRAFATLLMALVAGSAVGMVAVTTGCGGSKEKEQTPAQAGLPNPTSTAPTPTAPPAKGVARGRVPRALAETESAAEDLVDFARAKKRAKVVKGAEQLRRVVQVRAAATLEKSKVPQALISSLETRAQSIVQISATAGFLEIALAANQVSGLMPQLYAHYADPIPPEVLKLDYLDREAQFRSIAKDQFHTLRAIKDLSSTWNALRPKVVKAGGANAAARFSRHVEEMRALARTFKRAGIRKEAAKGLALVDVLERVFRHE